MKYGFSLRVRGNQANHDGIVAIARHGELLGFASATIADHVVVPVAVESQYPYDASGIHPTTGDAIEPLSLMAFVAGATTTLRLVTSVLILPHRNPVLAAKMIASIEVLLKGRVTLGIGVGWMIGCAKPPRRSTIQTGCHFPGPPRKSWKMWKPIASSAPPT